MTATLSQPWQHLVTAGHTWQQLVTNRIFTITCDNYLVTSGNILVMPNNFLFCLNIFCSQIVTVCDTRQLLVTTGNNLALVATYSVPSNYWSHMATSMVEDGPG